MRGAVVGGGGRKKSAPTSQITNFGEPLKEAYVSHDPEVVPAYELQQSVLFGLNPISATRTCYSYYATMAANNKTNKLAFLSMPAPASYVAGLGRG